MSRMVAKKSYSSMAQSRLTPGKIILLAFLSLLFLIFLASYLFLKFYTPSITVENNDDDIWGMLDWSFEASTDPDGLPIASANTENTDSSGNPIRKGCYGFLIVAKEYTGWNTDTMMYVMFDTKENKISIAQLPRDTYVNNTQGSRLNSIMGSGRNAAIRNGKTGADATTLGLRALGETIKMTLGVPVNYYVFIDLKGFKALVDIVGGVEMDIPFHMYYEDPYQDLYINLPKGPTLLDGDKAEQFVRYRSGYVNGDIGRLDAQKQFLSALVKKLITVNISKIQDMINLAEQYITTNISGLDMLAFAKEILQVDTQNIRMITMPGEWVPSINRYSLYRQETIDIINKYFNPYENDIAEENFNIKEWARREIQYADLEGVTMGE